MSSKLFYLLPILVLIAIVGAVQAWVVTRYFQGSSDERIARLEKALNEKDLALNQLVPQNGALPVEKKRQPASVR